MQAKRIELFDNQQQANEWLKYNPEFQVYDIRIAISDERTVIMVIYDLY